jgi:hypothetical protein
MPTRWVGEQHVMEDLCGNVKLFVVGVSIGSDTKDPSMSAARRLHPLAGRSGAQARMSLMGQEETLHDAAP